MLATTLTGPTRNFAKGSFEKACRSLLSTIYPIVIAWRFYGGGGKVGWGIGAGMFINSDGWFITAGHILAQVPELVSAIEVTNSKKRKKGRDITHYVLMIGTWSGPKIKMRVDVSLDFGIARIEGVKPPPGCVFPKFRVRDVEQGELLCRAGYPFLSEDYSPQWNRDNQFEFTNLFPVPVFVNEALVSRFISDMEGRRRWIETSSPGLKGQSGGPLFDIHGNVCGMQVNTAHYPLGFKGKARNQVLNVGRAIHVSAIIEQLEKDNIPYSTEEDSHGR